jgi:hypothetical protein
MTVYTIDRFEFFQFISSYGGQSLTSTAAVAGFVFQVTERLFGEGGWIAVFAAFTLLAGAFALWKGTNRWWVLTCALGIAVPALLVLYRGSAGYTRNLGHLVGPLAIICAVGAGFLMRMVCRLVGQQASGVAALAALLVGTAWAGTGHRAFAQVNMPPDWGRTMIRLHEEQPVAGSRWFARCLANHWPINWYEPPPPVERCFDLRSGESIELAMGAEFHHRGEPTIYRIQASGDGFIEERIPEYIASSQVGRPRDGVELRRWQATLLNPSTHNATNSDSRPLFVAVRTSTGRNGDDWRQFWRRSNAFDREIVPFQTARHSGQDVWSMIVRADSWPSVRDALLTCVDDPARDIRCFALKPL